MKKNLWCALLLSALFVLASCGKESNSLSSSSDGGEITSSIDDNKPVSYKDYAEVFNAKVSYKTNTFGKTTEMNYLLDHGKDHVSLVQDGDSYFDSFFVRDQDDQINQLWLNEKNEVIQEIYPWFDSYDGLFVNVFEDIDDENAIPTLVINDTLTDFGKKCMHTFFPGYNDQFKDTSASLMNTGKEITFAFKTNVSSTIVEINASLLKPSQYKKYTLSPSSESDGSKNLAKIFERLKENNYTCTISYDEEEKYQYFVNKDGFYGKSFYTNSGSGILKNANGYWSYAVENDEKAYFGESKTEAEFLSSIPSFDFSPSILQGNATAKNIQPKSLSRAFLFKEWMDGNLKIFDISETEDTVEFSYGRIPLPDKPYKAIFSNIGKTVLPIDKDALRYHNWWNYQTKIHWYFDDVIGSDYYVPAWTSLLFDASQKKVNNYRYLDAYSLLNDEEKAIQELKDYFVKLNNVSSHVEKWTESEWKVVANNVTKGDHKKGLSELYHLNSTYSMEVYCSDKDSEGNVTVGIYAGPDFYFKGETNV